MRAKIFKITGFLLILSAVFCLQAFRHPFYLSVTDLKYNPADKCIQGSVKMFVNDLEAALGRIHQKPVDLLHIKDTAAINTMLFNYLRSRLSFQMDGKFINYHALGFEQEQETLWIFIESEPCGKPGVLGMQNSLLYDFLPQQMNIVHFEVLDQSRSFKLNYPDRALEFNFN